MTGQGGTYELTSGDRRELRSLIKKQFQVLRNDVKRREAELRSEIETELLKRYRAQDERLEEARREQEVAADAYRREIQRIADSLRDDDPNLSVAVISGGRVSADDNTRRQLHTALIAAVPARIADALTKLDQQEIDLLRELTVGALATDEANGFLGRVPTVGELVPRARLDALEAGPS